MRLNNDSLYNKRKSNNKNKKQIKMGDKEKLDINETEYNNYTDIYNIITTKKQNDNIKIIPPVNKNHPLRFDPNIKGIFKRNKTRDSGDNNYENKTLENQNDFLVHPKTNNFFPDLYYTENNQYSKTNKINNKKYYNTNNLNKSYDMITNNSFIDNNNQNNLKSKLYFRNENERFKLNELESKINQKYVLTETKTNKNVEDKLINKNYSNTRFNIIYLIDTTFSMKKYENFIYSLPGINTLLVNRYPNMKIGYVLYKDYKSNKHTNTNKHIKTYLPSKFNIKLPKGIEFSGGYDYSEDWGNAIKRISEIAKEYEENIVIHISDSNAHGSKFSDYDERDEEENVLYGALCSCLEKNIKFIGLLIDDLARKSFFECKKIYNKKGGYYEIKDISKPLEYNSLVKELKQKIDNIISYNYNSSTKTRDQNYFNDIDESNFEYKISEDRNTIYVEMKPLYEIPQYEGQKFRLLPTIKNNELESYLQFNKEFGFAQGFIEDCYLISSIISMTNIPLIFNHIFLNSSKITEKTKNIKMYIYENGFRKLISFKNTYATYKNELLFSKPYNNEIYGIALEKGFAVSKCENKSIKYGYKKIRGGAPNQAFETILGSETEMYYSNFDLYLQDNINGYKFINPTNLKKKIKKYIDLGGIVCFGVNYYLGGAHAYSLIGYKKDLYGKMFIEIVNPNRKGNYAKENIYYSKDDESISLPLNESSILKEDDFINTECKESLKSYKKTGYLIMEFESFYKWYNYIYMCDPMIGFYEHIIEFIPNGKNFHSFDFKISIDSKFRTNIFIKNDKNNNRINNYKLVIKNKYNNIINNDNFDNDNKISYGILEKNNYRIEIRLVSGMVIEDIIYLKIYTPQKLELEPKNNNIIYMRQKYPDIYSEMIFINNFVNKFCTFINKNNIDLIDLPKYGSIYYQPKQDIKNFYIGITNTDSGFFAETIFKKQWQNVTKIEKKSSNNFYEIKTKLGKFKCSKDYNFFDFDTNCSKNILHGKNPNKPIKRSKIIQIPELPNKALSNVIIDIIDDQIDNDNIHKVDIVYMIDSTVSMGEEVKNASNLVINNANILYTKYPNINFLFGVIYYNDPVDCKSDSNDYLNLTNNFKEIKTFCDDWKMQSGGDLSEDWAGAYEIALYKIKWRGDGKKFIVHICDAPAHGAKYSKDYDDNHKEKFFEYKLDNLIRQCAIKAFEIVGIYANEYAKKCFEECKKIYDDNHGLSFIIEEYNKNYIIDFIKN